MNRPDAVDELFALLPPPHRPLELPDDGDWRASDEAFGPLPGDYRRLIERYGTGTINDFMWMLNPGSKSDFVNLVEVSKTNLRALR